MLFNSYVFIFGFLPIAVLVYFVLGKFRLIKLAIIWMAIASLFFYAYWKISYLPLLLLSIAGNYLLGKQLDKAKPNSTQAKGILIAGISFNLGLLGYYKYAEFFITSVNQVFQSQFPSPEIVLPLAISFYTFTQIAYLVDAYRGETKDSNYDFPTYTLFVSFFPQLIAGPILRHDELIPQFRQLKNFIFSYQNLAMGVTLFILGLSKKVLIADNLSPWVAQVFAHTEAVTFLEAWVGALSYTLQLYFDFSGYSDMAIGLGWMMNIKLPINFNSPYKALSITDFWRRWHITLSAFLRDYLYIPLGGNRRGEIRRYANLFITMLLGGLWHGAGWTYVLWGGMHGVLLTINHGWRRLGIPLPKIFGWMMTFLAVVASWVLFRATSLYEGLEMLQAMMGMKGIILPNIYEGVLGGLKVFGVQFQEWGGFSYLPPLRGQQSFIVLVGLLLGVVFLPNTQEIMQGFKPRWWMAFGVSSLAVFCLLSLNRVSEFLYFQF
ncbi:MBOAT family O-acyltransferase [Phormidium sp. CCY1219]|uniref:MBOAT family O-acyltransferase n=1 Tax=Phormidium sp. CCY1219 TaxID=2886104 RepID=UPI002D1F12D0|nr:MBOAT family protein [Phormidium sp. CCY1219]MEB3831293.1 MBOAT family protein [Phormidium sp. CCY1219]